MQPLTLNSPVGETLVVTLPDPAVARRIMWTDDTGGGRRLPVHDISHIHRLLETAGEQSALYFFMEGEAADTPFAQVVRDLDRYAVEVKRELIEWPMAISGEGSGEVVMLSAPWNTADHIPVRRRHVVDRIVAGLSIYVWMSRTDVLSGLELDDVIDGPHRKPA